MKMPLPLQAIAMLAVSGSILSPVAARESRPDGGVAKASGHVGEDDRLALDSRKRDEHARHDHRRDREDARRSRERDGFDHGMKEVPITAGPGHSGHGWRYFSDPAAGRAVVIDPQGDYYFSRGKGLRLVAVTQPRP